MDNKDKKTTNPALNGPNYGEYSLEELRRIERSLDPTQFPERHKRLKEEIDRRLNSQDYVLEQSDFKEKQKYRTFWLRFCALFIDGLVFAPLTILNMYFWNHWAEHTGMMIRCCLFIIFCFSYEIYVIGMHGKFGQTLGKMVCKVKVFTVDDQDLNIRIAFKRELLTLSVAVVFLLTELPLILQGYNPSEAGKHNGIYSLISFFAFAADLIVLFSNNKRRALHDIIGGTVVVNLKAK